jgi:hypothetical protein
MNKKQAKNDFFIDFNAEIEENSVNYIKNVSDHSIIVDGSKVMT